ncbi:hypothetical protein Pmani_037564 [Petrolisthes manimaculis]|uniref:Uncharacterized protein n=1 Tax=Petrolisthes manimaculis TaxID=1843537 RepID=A0AAE1NHY0_9EUCA|nr:hypothetical protein Pmani_037564 [Petrolisthes manimaculis]
MEKELEEEVEKVVEQVKKVEEQVKKVEEQVEKVEKEVEKVEEEEKVEEKVEGIRQEQQGKYEMGRRRRRRVATTGKGEERTAVELTITHKTAVGDTCGEQGLAGDHGARPVEVWMVACPLLE